MIGDGLLLVAADHEQLGDFYKTVSSISFTLLGLWWVAVQLKYKEGAGDRARRRHAYAITLYFLLPGVMTLLSAVNSDLSVLWRLTFGVAAALGVIEVLLYATMSGPKSAGATALRVCALVLYALIAIVAIEPKIGIQLGLGLIGQEIEAILVGLLIVVGVNLAWFGLTEPVEAAGGGESSIHSYRR